MFAFVVSHVVFGKFVINSIFNSFKQMEEMVHIFSKFGVDSDGIEQGEFIHYSQTTKKFLKSKKYYLFGLPNQSFRTMDISFML